MCGRYTQIFSLQELIARFHCKPMEGIDELRPRYNLAPSQKAPVVLFDGRERLLVKMKWGFLPSWAKSSMKPLINARSETAAEKPSFRDSIKRKRCLVPASGFYEWQSRNGEKVPYHFQLEGGKPLAFAGIWEAKPARKGEANYSFAILTTEANGVVHPIHKRMPVILSEEGEEQWLDPTIQEGTVLQPLLTACPDELMEAFGVPPMVNAVANDFPDCLQQIRAV